MPDRSKSIIQYFEKELLDLVEKFVLILLGHEEYDLAELYEYVVYIIHNLEIAFKDSLLDEDEYSFYLEYFKFLELLFKFSTKLWSRAPSGALTRKENF